MKTSPSHSWLAHVVGEKASIALARNWAGTVHGVTSLGVFLKLTEQELIFLSTEKTPGPLTVNIVGESDILQTVILGDPALISPQMIRFPYVKSRINLQNTRIWRPGPLQEPSTGSPLNQRLVSVSRVAFKTRGNTGLGPLLPFFFDPQFQDVQIESSSRDLLSPIRSIQAGTSRGVLTDLKEHILPFLGRGPGLTPSGDDFVVGVLLGLNRWQHVLLPGDQLQISNQDIVDAAFRATTKLSANLIACAADRQADERLIQAVDHLMSGSFPQAQVVADLLTWGHSSGVDALIGMLAVVSGLTLSAPGSGFEFMSQRT